MEKKWIILIVVLVLVLGLLTFSYLIRGNSQNKVSYNSYTPINVTAENFALYLSGQDIVKSLPSNAVLLLRFYSFNNGVRIWGDSYVIEKSSVVKGTVDNPDITIVIHSKYIPDLTNGFCSTIEKAKANGDFAADTNLSVSSLLWKYRSMMSYRACLGF